MAGHVHSETEDGAYFVVGVDLSHVGDVACQQCVHVSVVRTNQIEGAAPSPLATQFRSSGVSEKESWNTNQRPIRGPPALLEV